MSSFHYTNTGVSTKQRSKTEDRRPKNEDLITFRPVKLQADEHGLNALKDAKIKRNRWGLRFVEKPGSNYKTKTDPLFC